MRTSSRLIGALSIALSMCTFVDPGAYGEAGQKPSSIGYPTVAAALTSLQQKPGANLQVKGGWTIVSEPTEQTLWSFVPANHPAYPAVVKRTVIKNGGSISIDMRVLCESAQAPCDQLVEDFEKLNGNIKKSLHQ